MARPPLRCWWDSMHVADFTPRDGRGRTLQGRYTDAALERWPIGVPLLSCSLPVATRRTDATNFLRGLLPEGAHLQALASLARVTTLDTYGMLARYGRDVAGALVLQLGDDPPEARPGSVEPYDDGALERAVASLDETPLGVHDDSELSLAGLQDKLLLVAIGDRWGRPVHGYPSTHILKIDDARHEGLVRAEAACLSIAHRIGLGSDEPQLAKIADRDCLIVSRFDRQLAGDEVHRRHQEDACQALDIDIDANRGRGKYESSGGPSLAQIASLLEAHARDPAQQLLDLLRLVTFTLVIGNADLHGKNIALLHDLDGHVTLAPPYDTVPTVLWPKLRRSTAVCVNNKTGFDEITAADLAHEAGRWGVPADTAAEAVATTTSDIHHALHAIDHPVLEDLISARAERLLGGQPAT